MVGGQEQHDTFKTYALADAFRSKLVSYQRDGVPFDVDTGLPLPMLRERSRVSCYELLTRYVAMKWPDSPGNSRRSVADALKTVAPALIRTDIPHPDEKDLRAAVYQWTCDPPAQKAGDPPPAIRSALRWLERHSLPLSEFEHRTRGPALVRHMLATIGQRLDGRGKVAPVTYARRRAVLFNMFEYAVELGVVSANPLTIVKVKAVKSSGTIDRRSVVNPEQFRRLIAAVGELGHDGPSGPLGQRLVAFFALMYYAALRPAEAIAFRDACIISAPAEGIGELLLERSMPRAGARWNDSGTSREARELKHRAEDDTREVPAHPDLVHLLRTHIERFGVGRGGRLFVGPQGGDIEEARYLAIWEAARKEALTPAEVASPLAKRPYDLRHAAVSTWLNAGVPPTQVAAWAGHSLEVLLRVYAKCIVGQDEEARRRLGNAFGTPDLSVAPPESEPDQPEEG
ncbi:MAG: tyrosine-type recombinase/integrase [Hamadaea sp.]|nr:tyrosine-type recombinase/integrase [Hamadaea sp.]NUS43222.1 tyrosine-type recombinase/integrase [Mycobacteriaceae bacterium]